MPHSLHTILRDIYDQGNSAFRILFESGGSSNAHSEWTIWKRVYDPATSSLRVTVSDSGTALFHGHLPSDLDVTDDWEAITWNSDTKSNFTHTNGSEEITIDNAGNYMVMVNLVADYDADNEIHYVKLAREPA